MRVLVTGASRGIGRSICLRLVQQGATVAASASSMNSGLSSLVDEVSGSDGKIIPIVSDLSDANGPEQLVKEAVEKLGGLDGLVSNAGVSRPATLSELKLEDWEYLMDVNVRAPWLLAKAAYPALRASRGSMVSVASMSGVQPYPNMGAYSPSKAGAIMLVRVLAQEWAAEGIRVNSVSPGLIHTTMTDDLYANADIKKAREQLIPMHRIGDPDQDIAGVVAFLLNTDAAYITGQNILADGGLMDAIHAQIVGRPVSRVK